MKTIGDGDILPQFRLKRVRHIWILGHTNASFTLDTYTHVTSDMQKQACGIVGGFMEDIFGKELKPWQENEKPETER